MEKSIFNQWGQDDSCFISTKACKEVEKMIKSKNLVIVCGHSGSGKSAIIQHIALQYRKQGWTVKRVKEVKDIVDEYNSSQFQKNKTICVFNDPLGKESFDEILNNSWQTHKEELELYLKAAKLVMSCRSHIICDARLTRYLNNQSNVVNIDDKENKLSIQEKRQILTKFTSNVKLSDEDCSKILEVETYFPLLCKLYSSNDEYKNKGIEFFTEPVTVLKEEILGFRKKDKGKYCALALLVFFNDSFCARDLFNKGKDTKEKFKHTLKICGLSTKTAPSEIGDNLHSLKGLFVKEVGDTYYFYHDFVMEVTTYVLGTDYPTEIIKFADIGFLRRRVELGNCEEHSDSFTVYLNDRYKEYIGERLFTELIGERILDVVLNPCLRNQEVMEIMKKKISDHGEGTLEKTWGGFCPIHIVSVFHNYELLKELIKIGVKVNQMTDDHGGWTPLMLAAGNDTQETQEYRDDNHEKSDSSLACGWEVNPALVDGFDKQDCTVVFLLQKDNISNNLYDPDSYFSLFVSCQVDRAERMIFLE
uniref:Novel STAND NTPase 3 domain-containing protein n=1 Tax=Magallana gigas TaxID=29159 RepID=A0A8W8IKD2_MAGGI